MTVISSTYYDLTRLREVGPEAKDWSAVDLNFETISLLLKSQEQHIHSGTAAIKYPGYDPTTPILSTLSEITTGGVLPPGTVVGVRLAYLNALGLETDASPEVTITLSSSAARPLTPTLVTKTAAAGLPGGTYIYVITKVKATGETLPSDVLAVDVSYDTTYSVTLGFDAINTYTDGTTGIRIYRSMGLNSSFQLLTTVTTAAQATYVDTNAAPAGPTTQPPSSNTFDAGRKVRINWAALTHPTPTATKLRVYVTQQANLWSTQHLLSEIDLLASPPTFIDYLGNESLQSGWPKSTSQIPTGAPKVNLTTEATGAPTLTANMNFAGFQALNMRLHNNSGAPASPTNGYIYYDTSTNNVRAYINGAWVNWGTTTATAYVHPAEETGGHAAANIRYAAGVPTPTVKTALDNIFTTAGARKQVTVVNKNVGVTANPTTASTTAALIPEMNISGLLPAFNSQYIKATFSGHFKGSAAGMNISVAIEYDTITIEESVRTYTVPFTNGNIPFQITYITQMGTTAQAKQVRALWWVDTGTATAIGVRRSLVTELVF